MTDFVGDLVDLDGSRVPHDGRPRRWRPLDLLTAGGVAVALIGSSIGAVALSSSTSLAAGSTANITAATLAGSEAALKKEKTLRFSATVRENVNSQTVRFSFKGAVDNVGKTAQFDASIAGQSVEERLIGGLFYLRLPASEAQGLPWVSIPISSVLSAAGSKALASGTDPAGSLDALKGLTDVQRVGTATVDGVATVHYTGRASLAGAAALINSSAAGASGLSALASQSIKEDVFIGGDGLVRRLRAVGALQIQGQSVDLDTTDDFTDFNKPVTVVAPPADQVRQVNSLAELSSH